MARLSLYHDTRKKDSHQNCPIKIIIRVKKTTAVMHTGISVPPSHWDKRNEKVILNPKKETYNRILKSKMLEIENAMLACVGPMTKLTALEVRDRIISHLTPEEATPVLFCQRMQEFADTRPSPRTKEIYHDTLKRIRNFCKHDGMNPDQLQFEDINKSWLHQFEQYLSPGSKSQNTRNIHLRNIRAVFNDAIDENLITCYPFRKYEIRHIETAKRSLSLADVRMFWRYQVEPWQQQYKDMFFLILFLCGINIIDLANLRKTDLQNGRIQFNRSKTKRLYSIKVEPEAMELINRLKGKDRYLVDILDRVANHKDYTKRLDMSLKKIGPIVAETSRHKKTILPLFPKLSSYWARHTWATVCSELGIPVEVVSQGLGHSYGSKITAIYINFAWSKVDEANRQLIDAIVKD